MRRLPLLILLLVLLGAPASAQAVSSVELHIDSVQVDVPSRGQATATITATTRDVCHEQDGTCAISVNVLVSPDQGPCYARGGVRYGGPTITTDGTTTFTQVLEPRTAGTNWVCVDAHGDFGLPAPMVDQAFTIAEVYPAGDTLNCSNFPSQRAAQEMFNKWRPRDPYVLDADNDGRACQSSPCPCYFGAEYPAPTIVPIALPAPLPAPTPTTPAATPDPPAAPGPAKCVKPKAVQTLTFSRKKYPHIRSHVRSAIKHGWPRVMVLNRAGADERRSRLLRGVKTRKGYDRDEYPAAVGRGTGKGLERGAGPRGWKADVQLVPSRENRSHGASLGAKLKRFCDGTRFQYAFN